MNFNTFFDIITNLSPLVLIIGTSVGLYYFKHLNTIGKLFLLYLGVNLLIDLTSRFLARYLGNNLFLIFVITFLELFVFITLYQKLIKKKKLTIAFGVLGIVYTLIESIFMESFDIKLFQPYSKALVSLCIIILAVVYFFELIKDEEKLYKKQGYYLSLNSVILCFFSLQFLLFIPINFLVSENNKIIGMYAFTINAVLLVLFYLYLTYFIWKRGRNLKQ